MKEIMGTFLTVALFITLAGCSETNEAEPSESVEETVQPEEKEATETEATEEEVAETEIEEESIPWAGEWIFLSDDNLGQLRIEQVSESQVKYHLGGSRINPVNGSSYGNALEGSGTINGNQIEFTNDLVEDCSGIMVREDNIISVKLNNESCHTPQVYLDGEYKLADSYREQPLFMVKNQQFQIYGLSLGDTPSQAKELIGNPEYEGPDETGFDEWIQQFNHPSINKVAYFENAAVSIHGEANIKELEEGIERHFKGERYMTEEGAEYLYLPASEQLLIYTPNPNDPSKVSLFVTYADGNFHVGVENGWILKK